MPSFDATAILTSLKPSKDPCNLGLPPGPTTSAARQMIEYIFDYRDFLLRCRQRYGDIFTTQLPGLNVVWISEPELVQQLFTGNPDELYAGESTTMLKPILGENSLLLEDGPQHRRDRKLMMPIFHNQRLHTYCDSMQRITSNALAKWQPGNKRHMLEEMQNLTLDIIIETVFGITDDLKANRLRELLKDFIAAASSSIAALFIDAEGNIINESFHRSQAAWWPVGRALKKVETLNQFLFAEIRSRRESGGEGDDVLGMFLQSTYDDGQPMSDKQIRDQLVTLLLAGHDTTAATLAWIVWNLWEYPGVLKKVRDELDAVTGGNPLKSSQLRQLKYMDAVIKESLRLRPVIPNISRHLQVPMQLGTWSLPAGIAVSPAMTLTHSDDATWPDADQFKPERFLESGAKPSTFYPFGGGNRTCIGMGFAYVEMKIVLSHLVKNVRYQIPKKYRPKQKVRIITNVPTGGVPFIVN